MPEELAVGAIGDLVGGGVATEAAGLGISDLAAAGIGGEALGAGTGGLAAGFDLLGGETAVNAGASAVPLAGGAELGGAAGAASLVNGGGGGSNPLDFNQSIADATGAFDQAASAGVFNSFGAPLAGAGPTGGFSFPSISQIGSGFNIASSLYGMDQASQLKKLAMLQANKATPWQSAGGGDLAAQQLLALLSGKTDVSSLPGYKAGEQAVTRQGAANGWLGSGNMMAALKDYGSNFYNNAVTQLGGLAGAQFNPATSGSLALNGATNSAALNLAAMSNINKTIETQPAWR